MTGKTFTRRILGRAIFLRLAIYLPATYLICCIFLFFYQDHLLYYPSPDCSELPDIPYEQVQIQSTDEVTLSAWFFPVENPRFTILFNHGNAGNMTHRLSTVEFWRDLGCQVLLYDYRGYGSSSGKPSEQGLFDDAQAAWSWLVTERKIEPEAIIIHGRSLGAAVAVHCAAMQTEKPAALIVESAFRSVPILGQEFYPMFPVRFLSTNEFDNEKSLVGLTMPKLFIHAVEDEIIPYSHGMSLYEQALYPKQFIRLQGFHNTAFLTDSHTYRKGVIAFLGELASEPHDDSDSDSTKGEIP